jgi:hypothetical protein
MWCTWLAQSGWIVVLSIFMLLFKTYGQQPGLSMRLKSGMTGDIALTKGTKMIGNFSEFADRHHDYQAWAWSNQPSPARDHTTKAL